MLDYRSQFPKPFRDMMNGKIPKTWPKDILSEMSDLWHLLGKRARDFSTTSKEELALLGLKPTSNTTGKDVVSGVGLWNKILEKNAPHSDLKKYLSWQLEAFLKIDKEKVTKSAIKCSLGNNIDMEDDEIEHEASKRLFYNRFKEDIRDPYTLGELNDRNCKVVHFVQALWPKEHLEMVESMRLLKECIDKPIYYRSLNKFEVKKALRGKARTTREAIGSRYWYFDIDTNRFTIDTLKSHLKKMHLYKYLKLIVMSSTGRFHLYFNADINETAHWNPMEPVPIDTRLNREKFAAVWDKLCLILDADVGKSLTQKASTPGYRNPRTSENVMVVHSPKHKSILTIEEAGNIASGILGEDIELPTQIAKPTRVLRCSGVIPTFQQYNDYHGYEETIVNAGTLNEKVKKLTTHIHRYIDYPFAQVELDRYFDQVVLPAFDSDPSCDEVVYKKFEDWVRHAEKFARTSGFKHKKYITQQQIDEIDEYLGKFQVSIMDAQEQMQELTPLQEVKIPRLMLQVREALLDPNAKLTIKDGCLVGKIPCKYLKGPENGLGRYNELIKALCRMGLIHRDIKYSRPHKLPNATWAGEARTWKFYLVPQAPQIVNPDIWNHSYLDYCRWLEQEEKPLPDWVHDYQRLAAA